jgi:hypothetical protein
MSVPQYASRSFPAPDTVSFTQMAVGCTDTIEVAVVDREYGAGNRTAFAARSMPAELKAAGVNLEIRNCFYRCCWLIRMGLLLLTRRWNSRVSKAQ